MDELIQEQLGGSFVLFVLYALFVVTWVIAAILQYLAWRTLKHESPDVWGSVKQLPLAERTIRSGLRGLRFWFSGEYRKLGIRKVTFAGRAYNASMVVLLLIFLAGVAYQVWLLYRT